MPKRRNESRGAAAGAAKLAGSLIFLVWAKATRRPVDTCAILAAVAACAIIGVNALFLQSGSLPTPFRVTAPAPAANATSRPVTPSPHPVSHTVEVLRSPPPVAARREDPIGQFIGRSSRVMAVQRALANYGYGQIKVSGVVDRPTSAAIARFEREHNLPVTGRISERLVSDLSVLVGHPLD